MHSKNNSICEKRLPAALMLAQIRSAPTNDQPCPFDQHNLGEGFEERSSSDPSKPFSSEKTSESDSFRKDSASYFALYSTSNKTSSILVFLTFLLLHKTYAAQNCFHSNTKNITFDFFFYLTQIAFYDYELDLDFFLIIFSEKALLFVSQFLDQIKMKICII